MNREEIGYIFGAAMWIAILYFLGAFEPGFVDAIWKVIMTPGGEVHPLE